VSITAPAATPGVDLAASSRTPEVVTLSNLRSISRSRVLGLGITTLFFAVIMIVGFGVHTDSADQTTIDFGTLSSAPSIPRISSSILQLLAAVIGVVLVLGSAWYLLARRATASASRSGESAATAGSTAAAGTSGSTVALVAGVVGIVLGLWALATAQSWSAVPGLPHLHGRWLELVAGLAGAALIGVAIVVVRRRSRAAALFVGLVGVVVALWAIALALGLNDPSTGQLRYMTIPVATTAFVLGGIVAAAGLYLVIARPDRGANAIFLSSIVLFIISFLVWVARGSATGSTTALAVTALLAATFISATPLMFGSLSGVLCERSGVVNIAIEGQFLFGAMAAEIVSSVIGNNTAGLVAGTATAALFGGLVGLVLAFMALHYRADQIIVGVVLVAFCTGMTTFLTAQVLVPYQSLNAGYGALPLALPVLSRIPVIGPTLFDQSYFIYLAFILAGLIHFGLFRTRWGLRVRSVGEKPRASETVGLSVSRIRYSNVVMGGMVAGIGGAAFTLGTGSIFGVGITEGYGFIALAIMIVGRWKPWGALGATLLFGFTISLASQISLYSGQFPLPSEFLNALPYIITIGAVAGLTGRVRPPAADGQPYSRE